MTLAERARRLLHDARALVDAADREARGMTGEELESYERLMADFDATQATIRAVDRVAELEAANGGTAARSDGRAGETADGIEGLDAERAAMLAPEVRAALVARNRPEYRGGFARFLRGVATAGERRDLQAGALPGSVLVPAMFQRTLLERLAEENVLRSLATVITTETGAPLTVPSLTAEGEATYGAEESAYVGDDDTFGPVTFGAHKAKALCKVSEELAVDAFFDLEAYIRNRFAKRIGLLEETKMIATGGGSVANEPDALFTVAVIGVNATAAAVVTEDEIVSLYHSVRRPYRKAGSWLTADTTIKALRLLKTGVAGDRTYLWQPGLAAGEPDKLLGRPVFSCPAPAMAANARAIGFGDVSAYWIRDVGAMAVQRLVELYSGTGQIGFRGWMRNDGKLTDADAFKVLKMAAA